MSEHGQRILELSGSMPDDMLTHHSGNTTISSDVGWDSLKRHDGGSTCLFGNLGLLDVHDIHDDTGISGWLPQAVSVLF